MRLLW